MALKLNALSNIAEQASKRVTSYVENAIPVTLPPFPTIAVIDPISLIDSVGTKLPFTIATELSAVISDVKSKYPTPGDYDYRPGLTGTALRNQEKYNDTIAKIKASPTNTVVKKTNAESLEGFEKDRLYTILPRSAEFAIKKSQYAGDANRGRIAFIKLLTKRTVTQLTDKKVKTLDTQDFNELISNPSGYRKFFLTDVQVSYNEKTQITNTFGDGEVTYFFGRQPIIFNLSGILFDAIEQDWFTKMISLYADTLRGTKLAQNYELVELTLPNMILKGSILSLSHQQNSNSDQNIQFSMQFMAKEVRPTKIASSIDSVSSLTNKMVDFTASKQGGKPSLSKRPTTKAATLWGVGGFQSTTKISSAGTLPSPNSKIAAKIDETNAFAESLFSPVYGILTTITKVVRETTGSATSFLSSLTTPVNEVLKSISNISDEVVSVANLIEAGIGDIVGVPERMASNFNKTIQHLKNSAGVVSRLPEDLSQIVQRSVRRGKTRSGSAMLSSGNKRIQPKAALLSSGTPYSPRTAYKI